MGAPSGVVEAPMAAAGLIAAVEEFGAVTRPNETV